MQKTLNIPNILTLVRLLLVPVIIALLLVLEFQNNEWSWIVVHENFKISTLLMIAGIIFIIASLTDFLDGYIARKYNQVTDFGKFFDPIADKLLVNSVLILFSSLGILPVWIALVLILRDTFVDFIRMILSSKKVTLAAGRLGKFKTIFQMLGLSIIFFLAWFFENGKVWEQQIILVPMYLAVFFSIYSGIYYYIQAKPNLF